MTEYDYSPEGYQRYMDSQSRISKWTHQTANAKLADPFVHTPSEADGIDHSDFYTDSPRSGSPPERDNHRSGGGSHRSHHTSSHNTHSHSSSSHPRSHSSSRTSSSTATYTPHRSYTTAHAPQYHATATIPTRSESHPPGIRSFMIDPRATRVVLPPPDREQTYIIIPPDGRTVDVVSHDSKTTYPAQYLLSHPASRKPESLIKRVFGGSHAPSPTYTHTRSSSHGPSWRYPSSGYGHSTVDMSGGSSHTSRRTGVESGGKPKRSHRKHDSY